MADLTLEVARSHQGEETYQTPAPRRKYSGAPGGRDLFVEAGVVPRGSKSFGDPGNTQERSEGGRFGPAEAEPLGNIPGGQYYHDLSPGAQQFVNNALEKYGVDRAKLADEIESRVRANPDFLKQGAEWYPQAHNLAAGIERATQGKVDLNKASAVIAVLSPQATWEANAETAARMAQFYADGKADGLSPVDARIAFQDAWQREGWGGQTKSGDNAKSLILPSSIERGFSLLQGPPPTPDEELSSVKIRSFDNNILTGGQTPPPDVTVDVHMAKAYGYSAGLDKETTQKLMALGSNQQERTYGNGRHVEDTRVASVGYSAIASVTREVADRLGVSPAVVQAGYWLSVQFDQPEGWPTPRYAGRMDTPFADSLMNTGSKARPQLLRVSEATDEWDPTDFWTEEEFAREYARQDAVGRKTRYATARVKYSEDEERDDHGRWTSGGSSGPDSAQEGDWMRTPSGDVGQVETVFGNSGDVNVLGRTYALNELQSVEKPTGQQHGPPGLALGLGAYRNFDTSIHLDGRDIQVKGTELRQTAQETAARLAETRDALTEHLGLESNWNGLVNVGRYADSQPEAQTSGAWYTPGDHSISIPTDTLCVEAKSDEIDVLAPMFDDPDGGVRADEWTSYVEVHELVHSFSNFGPESALEKMSVSDFEKVRPFEEATADRITSLYLESQGLSSKGNLMVDYHGWDAALKSVEPSSFDDKMSFYKDILSTSSQDIAKSGITLPDGRSMNANDEGYIYLKNGDTIEHIWSNERQTKSLGVDAVVQALLRGDPRPAEQFLKGRAFNDPDALRIRSIGGDLAWRPKTQEIIEPPTRLTVIRTHTVKYSPDQPRDDHGRFGESDTPSSARDRQSGDEPGWKGMSYGDYSYYMSGGCAIFAGALQEEYGMKVAMTWDSNGGLVHAFAYDDNGNAYDAGGKDTFTDIEATNGDLVSSTERDVSRSDLEQYAADGKITFSTGTWFDQARDYVRPDVASSPKRLTVKYSPDQPRDDHGRFGESLDSRYEGAHLFGPPNEWQDPVKLGTTTDLYGKWLNDLPYEQYKALDQWREWGTFSTVQSLLREQPIPMNNNAPYGGILPIRQGDVPGLTYKIDQLDQAIASAPPLPADAVVYRQFDSNQFGDLKPGDVVKDNGFVATAPIPDLAVSYGSAFDPDAHSPILAEVLVPEGTHLGVPPTLSDDGKGNKLAAPELVVPRGSEFTVMSAGDGRVRLALTHVPDSPPAIPTHAPSTKSLPMSAEEHERYVWHRRDVTVRHGKSLATARVKYSPDQPRDEHGRFGETTDTPSGEGTIDKRVSELQPGDKIWDVNEYSREWSQATVQSVAPDPKFEGYTHVVTDRGAFSTANEASAGIVREDHPEWANDSKIIERQYLDVSGVYTPGGDNPEAKEWRADLPEYDQHLLTYWESSFDHVQEIRSNPDDPAAKHFESLVQAAPTTDDPVYRGIPTTADWSDREGRTFRISAPASGSTDIRQAAAFGQTILQIEGAPAHLLGNGMNEAVTLPGRYEVTGVHEEKTTSSMNVIGLSGYTGEQSYQVIDAKWLGSTNWTEGGGRARLDPQKSLPKPDTRRFLADDVEWEDASSKRYATARVKYSPDQPRDDHGRFGETADTPTTPDNYRETWKPTMTPEEGHAWAKAAGTKYEGTVVHVTNRESVDGIKGTGFDIQDKVEQHERGAYFATDRATASTYGFYDRNDRVLSATVVLQNPLELDLRTGAGRTGEDFRVAALAAAGLEAAHSGSPGATTEALKSAGYDGVVIQGPATVGAQGTAIGGSQVVVFDKEQITVIGVERSTSDAAIDRAFAKMRVKYSEDEERDDHGRWTSGGDTADERIARAADSGPEREGRNPDSPKLRAIAEGYMEKAGLPYNPDRTYAPVDVARAHVIADLYDKAVDEPHNPTVAASYAAFVDETHAQYEYLRGQGYEHIISAGEGEPYHNSREFSDDVRENHSLTTLPTLGESSNNTVLQSDNPLLQASGNTAPDTNGRTVPLTYNDEFRWVHDIFGHVKEGNQTGPRGEENAWRQHVQMYTPEAARAMTTETRGQNSWFNYGPGNPGGNTPLPERTFPDQKVTVLPEWVSDINGEPPSGKSLKYSPDQPRDEHGRFGETADVPDTNARQTEDGARGSMKMQNDLNDQPENWQQKLDNIDANALALEEKALSNPALRTQLETAGAYVMPGGRYPDVYGVDNAIKQMDWAGAHSDMQPVEVGARLISAYLQDSWAGSASDNNPESLAMQYAISEKFGVSSAGIDHYLGKSMDIWAGDTADIERAKFGMEQTGAVGTVSDISREVGASEAVKAYVDTVYERTQSYLSGRGIDEVTLYRGMHFLNADAPPELNPKTAVADFGNPNTTMGVAERDVLLNPLSSFTTAQTVAGAFAGLGGIESPSRTGVLLQATVPADRIFSWPGTGPGCQNEREVIAVGGHATVGLMLGFETWSDKYGPMKDGLPAEKGTASA